MDNLIIIDENDCKIVNFTPSGIYYHLKSNMYCKKNDKKFYPVSVCKKCLEYFDFKKDRLCNNCKV